MDFYSTSARLRAPLGLAAAGLAVAPCSAIGVQLDEGLKSTGRRLLENYQHLPGDSECFPENLCQEIAGLRLGSRRHGANCYEVSHKDTQAQPGAEFNLGPHAKSPLPKACAKSPSWCVRGLSAQTSC